MMYYQEVNMMLEIIHFDYDVLLRGKYDVGDHSFGL